MCTRIPYTEDLPFKDFTFKCKDGEVKANKCILWSRCAFFKTTAWNIEGMVELEVEQTVEIVQKTVDYFYGRPTAMEYPQIDFSTYALINKLNPSPNNVMLLIPIDSKKWNDVLELRDEFESVGCSYDQLTSCIVGIILENGMDAEELKTINTDILRKFFVNDNVHDYSLLEILAHTKRTDAEFDELFDLIRLEYVSTPLRYIGDYDDPPMYYRILSKAKKVTKESIRQAFLHPSYRRHYDITKSIVKSSNQIRAYYSKDKIQVLGKNYALYDIFENEAEFNRIVERDTK